MALILIVEDEEPIRVLAESILQEHGYAVLTAANSTEARALLDVQSVDLLFTDINLGEENGLDLAAEVSPLKPSMKILYTTGAGVTDGTRVRMVDGAEFLPKPYRIDDLIVAVERLLTL